MTAKTLNKIPLKENYSLDRIRPEDSPSLVKWFNDSGLALYMTDSEDNKIYTDADIQSMLDEPQGSIYLALRTQEKIIGYASIYDLNIEKTQGEFSFLIGEPEFRGKGLGRLLVNLLCQKAKEHGLAKLICSIYRENKASIKSVEANGFIKVKEFHEPRAEYFYEKNLLL